MTDRGDDSADGPPADDTQTDDGESDESGLPNTDALFDEANDWLARGRRVYDRHFGNRNRLAVALAAVVVVGIAFRLFVLGARVAHYDEGRVAYWSLHHARTDSFVYRFIIHGPLVQHLHRWLFPLVGANDFTMRLPVALIGGALPGSVWLFREHLRDSELVGGALFLALNPLLLYYSRFMRSDLLVATLMFVALGMVVRFYDTRRVRYLYGAAAFVALGFSSKENAVVYLLTWGGATALLAEHALFRPREYDSGFALLAAKARAIAGRGRRSVLRVIARYTGHLVGTVVVAGFLVLFMYAPRGDVAELVPYMVPGTANYVGFWEGVTSPGQWGHLVNTTLNGFSVEHTVSSYPHTFDGIIGGLEYWFGTEGPTCSETAIAGIDVTGLLGALGIKINAITGYPCTLGKFINVLLTAALPFFALAVVGTLVERYARPVSRNVVMFAAYIGFVSLIGYPLGTDIFGAWILVHVLVPLSIPAGVALAKLYRWGTEAFADRDALSVVVTALLLLVIVGQMVFVSAGAVYTHSASGEMVQYAQPSNDLNDPLADLDRIAASHDGSPDLVVFGDELVGDDKPVLDTQPHCVKWYNPMLPLPWYLYSGDVSVSCEGKATNLTERVERNPPPVILVAGKQSDVPTQVLEEDYVRKSGDLRQGARERVFWIHEDWL